MKKIKENWFLLLYAAVSVVLFILSPLTGEEIVAFPWRTFLYIFMLLLVEEGLRKENILLPLLRFFNSVRSTPFLLAMILTSVFLLSLVLYDFFVILIILPFTLKLLKVSNKTQYASRLTALVVLLSELTSLISPFNPAGLYILLESSKPYSEYILSVLPVYLITLLVFILEAFLLLRKAMGDEIYLHIEDEDYWDKDRKGIRVLYTAFFLTLLFGSNFNTIDLFIVILGIFLLLDRKVFKSINWSLYLTFLLMGISSYVLKNMVEAGVLPGTITSVLFTRLGGTVFSSGYVRATLPGALLSFSPALLYALREIKEKKKETALCYLLLALPHILIYLLFAFLF